MGGEAGKLRGRLLDRGHPRAERIEAAGRRRRIARDPRLVARHTVGQRLHVLAHRAELVAHRVVRRLALRRQGSDLASDGIHVLRQAVDLAREVSDLGGRLCIRDGGGRGSGRRGALLERSDPLLQRTNIGRRGGWLPSPARPPARTAPAPSAAVRRHARPAAPGQAASAAASPASRCCRRRSGSPGSTARLRFRRRRRRGASCGGSGGAAGCRSGSVGSADGCSDGGSEAGIISFMQ